MSNETEPSEPDSPPEPPFQFSLRTLLALPLGVALFAAMEWLVGIQATLMIAAIAAGVVGMAIKRVRGAAFAVGVLALVMLLLFPFPSHVGPAASRNTCISNLKGIAVALQAYHSDWGCFPPPYLADSKGKPMHSWRVLILPYLDRRDVYQAYRFDEPWDGPTNRKVAATLFRCFLCPADGLRMDTVGPLPLTNYLAVIGPRTAWPGDKVVSLNDITDGPGNTILVVEVADSGIQWAEPRDLHVLQMPHGINRPGQGISCNHGGGAMVAFADGSVKFLPDSITPAQLDAMLSIAGKEVVRLPE
jgi:prepilin-type processing-associated H-X9-DG protein